MSGRRPGWTKSAALALCARIGGNYRAFACAQVAAIIAKGRAGDRITVTLAEALGVDERTARRIMSAIEGDRRRVASSQDQQRAAWRAKYAAERSNVDTATPRQGRKRAAA